MDSQTSVTSNAIDFNPALLRKTILQMAFNGQSVHIPCAFSIVEILSHLYSKTLRFNSKNPLDPERDYLVLSKGHGVMALYACFHQIGWIAHKDIQEYFKDGSKLRGLSEADIPGIEVTSGSLGHGFPVAAGIALGLKRLGSPQKVFCIAGDGEMNEGTMWETLLFAGHHRLDNLTLIVDANDFQAMGHIHEVLKMEPWRGKFESFGWSFEDCDGHSLEAIHASLGRLDQISGKPKALVAQTVKGKGISFMERDNRWHYSRLDSKLLAQALAELEPHLENRRPR